ncbi:MAG: tRNA (adenosine(37)-N6)-dimethylallyltransferase MiaA [SAR202 cluster bacterium]|nr:tRNA (adenosine(37)-N6)-dimethylallyltransferase MiaA [SAR202 cluster bacterium]
MTSPTVIFIVGATASGKTAASLDLAERVPVEIVNADSRQVYRRMDIGTAKPTAAQRAAVPHHLIDIVDPDESYSLATFLEQARGVIADIAGRGKTPVVVGGTGQYVWGLAEGWTVPVVPPDAAFRAELEGEAAAHGWQRLHERLRAVDAEAAASIDGRNVRRVIRALEVWHVTGKRFSAQRRKVPPPFTPRIHGMWVPRGELYARIDARVDAMMATGFLDEVRRLLGMGYGSKLPSMSSAGYRELAAHLRGDLTLDEAVRRTKIATHSLARRQHTWFRRDDERIEWVETSRELARAAASGASPRLP